MTRTVFVVVHLMCASFGARAFVCEATDQDVSLVWDARTITMRVHDDDAADVGLEEVEDAVRWGASQWTSAACSDFAFDVGAPTSDRRVGFDWRAGSGSNANVNVVVFRNGDPADAQDAWLHLGSIIALTTVTFVRSTGEIVDADIEMNDVTFDFTACDPPACQPEHDVKNTITHELGHVLGLDHPPSFQPGAEEATMFASAPAGDVQKRDLAPDDVEGLCTLYPEGAPNGSCSGIVPDPPPSVRVTQVGCSSSSGSGLAWLLLPVLVARPRKRTVAC